MMPSPPSRPTASDRLVYASSARLLFIVGRDHPELFDFLRQEFAAQEAAGIACIFLDRRQGQRRQSVQPHEAERRRGDRRRYSDVARALRGLGCAIVRTDQAVGSDRT